VPKILVAADAASIRDELAAALVGPGYEVVGVARGQDVLQAVKDGDVDLVIADLQVGNMGGFAIAKALHLEEGSGRMAHTPMVLLLDREADKFLGGRAQVEAQLVKPVDAGTIRRLVKRLLAEHIPA
jgi:DNA-binding response OmpR family regulator